MAMSVATLANGLRIVTDPMPGLESVALGVWIGAGGRDERPEELGLAHFLEHMAFKGTESRSARDIAETVEAVGGYINAYTSRTQTAYHLRLLKDDLALGVDILADILRRPRFDPVEIERERSVILQEIARSADAPDDMVFDLLQGVAYADQPLGNPILGTTESVNALCREQMQAYLDREYHPGAMVVGAAGAVDPDRFVDQVAGVFGDMTRSSTPPVRSGPARFAGGDVRRVTAHEQTHLTIAFESVPLEDPRFFASWVTSEILGGGMSSRLFQSVREERGLAYAVYSMARSYTDTGKLTVYAGTAPDQTGAAAAAIAGEMRDLSERVTDQELGRAKASLRSAVLMALESPSSRADSAATDLLFEGRVVGTPEILEKIASVDNAAVKDFAGSLLTRSAPAVALVGPPSDLPDYASLSAAFAL